MPELWDSLNAAQQPPPAPDMWNAPMGVGSPAETAGAPSLMSLLGKYFAPKPRDENSPVEYRTASPMVNITTQDIADATDKAMAFSGGGLGIKAYHSSPHDFDRFDLSKIGTGEGAQVYGHGLYFAENPAVSGAGGQYWSQFMSRFPEREQMAADMMRYAKFDREKAIAQSQDAIDRVRANMKGATPEEVKNYMEPALQQRLATHELLTSGQPVGPRTYEVNINADPAHFLDWDKQFTAPQLEQFASKFDATSPTTRNMLEEWSYQNQKRGFPMPAGEDIVRELKGVGTNAKNFSRTLDEAGIPGIKYLDQGSRGLNPAGIALIERDLAAARAAGNVDKAGVLERELSKLKPSSNYVVFNPNLIDIMKKYGIAGAAPMAAGFGFPPVGNEQRM